MKTFEFSIIASGLDPQAKDFESQFYNAGCDDALVAFQKGHIILDFARDADSLEEAIASAVSDAIRAGAKVDRVEPDPLVSLSDMASRASVTRAAVTNYFKGTRGRNFPAPVARVTSDNPLWDWATVARWMYENHKLDKHAAIDAEVVKRANEAISRGEKDLGTVLKKRAEEYEKELEAA